MSYGGLPLGEACVQGNHLSRAAHRRAKRKHMLRCWQIGNAQMQHKIQVLEAQINMSEDGREAKALIESLAIHTADCNMIGSPIHYAGEASCIAKAGGLKSKSQHKRHLKVHQLANAIKHNRFSREHLPEMPTSAILCQDFENFQLQLHAPTSTASEDASINKGLHSGVSCLWCGIWQPLDLLSPSVIREATIDKDPPIVPTPTQPLRAADSLEQCSEGFAGADGVADIIVHGSSHTPLTEKFEVVVESSRPIYDTTPAMPTVGFLTVANCGALVACSYKHASLTQPLLAQIVEQNGGCAVYT
jgi:hypothetical protein